MGDMSKVLDSTFSSKNLQNNKSSNGLGVHHTASSSPFSYPDRLLSSSSSLPLNSSQGQPPSSFVTTCGVDALSPSGDSGDHSSQETRETAHHTLWSLSKDSFQTTCSTEEEKQSFSSPDSLIPSPSSHSSPSDGKKEEEHFSNLHSVDNLQPSSSSSSLIVSSRITSSSDEKVSVFSSSFSSPGDSSRLQTSCCPSEVVTGAPVAATGKGRSFEEGDQDTSSHDRGILFVSPSPGVSSPPPSLPEGEDTLGEGAETATLLTGGAVVQEGDIPAGMNDGYDFEGVRDEKEACSSNEDERNTRGGVSSACPVDRKKFLEGGNGDEKYDEKWSERSFDGGDKDEQGRGEEDAGLGAAACIDSALGCTDTSSGGLGRPEVGGNVFVSSFDVTSVTMEIMCS